MLEGEVNRGRGHPGELWGLSGCEGTGATVRAVEGECEEAGEGSMEDVSRAFLASGLWTRRQAPCAAPLLSTGGGQA